ncbi:serine/threonine protein kinase [Actinomadura barringtoniae]|uniref:Serine/threonine protein kinase n=1 Tax=Actinomadura barringtoniae TaxID=1427535 RepID=A0A939T228_9ACTN|nr:serine/threonine-protein kinase [Actinomadura barringtoniae]MBO2445838.1 serine/threonine protein kinase [Actinomadura barringtoniae]
MTEPLRTADPTRLGAYRITGRLGRGGMGTVYRGEDEAGHPVAVKVINPELTSDPAFRERFRREVTAARRVRRFSTAAVLDARLDGEPLYVVTEFVDGPTLEQAVEENGPLRGGALEGLAVGIATALSTIHGAGIVHRDLKPANVMLSPTGPRVIDFGIARAMDTEKGEASGITRTGQFVGTPAYIAPEIMQGGEVTAAADVFAWGCVVAYAGTGRAPFDATNVPAILYQVSHGTPVLDGLDADMHDLVAAALDKDPAKRPSSKDLLAQLVEHTGAETDPMSAMSARTRSDAASQSPTLVVPPAMQPQPDSGGRRNLWRYLPWLIPIPLVAAGIVGWTLVRSDDAKGDARGDNGTGAGAERPPAAGAQVIPQENFSVDDSDWTYDMPGCGKVADGTYNVEAGGAQSYKLCDVPGSINELPARMLYDMRIKLAAGPTGRAWAAGIVPVGHPDGRYSVAVRSDGTVRLRKALKGKDTELRSAKIKGFRADGFTRLQVLMDATGSGVTLKVWANGTMAFALTDDERPLKDGQMQIMVNRPGQGPNALAKFDDFSVSAPPARR